MHDFEFHAQNPAASGHKPSILQLKKKKKALISICTRQQQLAGTATPKHLDKNYLLNFGSAGLFLSETFAAMNHTVVSQLWRQHQTGFISVKQEEPGGSHRLGKQL